MGSISRALCAHLVSLTALALVGSGCTHPNVANLRAFRTALKSGDAETAGKYLAADARVWFGQKEGPGRPLTVHGGPWKEWDRFFNSNSTSSDMKVEGNSVSYIFTENNDYFRLIDGAAGKGRITYYFNNDGRITGRLISGVPGYKRPPDRLADFKRWCEHEHPGALEKIEFDPDNPPTFAIAKRWKELLVEWRAAEGLPAIE